MITRREILIALGASVLVSPLTPNAQPQSKVWHIGYLAAGSQKTNAPLLDAFLSGMRDLGYVEGRNLVIERRFADGDINKLPALAAELVVLKPDLIVAPPPSAAMAAKKATTTIPVVFALVPDPVGLGLIQSLARPGGNLTGVSNFNIEIAGKRLQLLKETIPGIVRIAVWFHPENPNDGPELKEIERAAKTLGLQYEAIAVRSPEQYQNALAAAQKYRADAVYITSNPLSFNNRTLIVELVAKFHRPAMYWLTDFVEDGGLIAYSVSFTDQFRRVATYVDKILKGAKPGELPVAEPTKLELAVNLRTAKALGITIPYSIMLRVDKVIE